MGTERLVREFDVRLVHTLFPLHPDTPPEGLPLGELFAAMDIEPMQERMRRLMAESGLAYGRRSMTYNSRRAQELAKWAETQPGGGVIHDTLYRAYFVDALNIAQYDVLADIAQRAGLNPNAGLEAIESGAFRDAVDVDWERSRRLGITGVPTFLAGQQACTGAQPYEVLAQLVTASGARRRVAL